MRKTLNYKGFHAFVGGVSLRKEGGAGNNQPLFGDLRKEVRGGLTGGDSHG